jgi:hypothetical protein
LQELDDEYMRKASNLVERRIAKVKEKVTLLPESPTPTGVEIALAGEIRAAVKAEKDNAEKFAFGLRADPKVMAALLSAPPFLSGLTAEGIERLRAAALESIYPEERAEIEGRGACGVAGKTRYRPRQPIPRHIRRERQDDPLLVVWRNAFQDAERKVFGGTFA